MVGNFEDGAIYIAPRGLFALRKASPKRLAFSFFKIIAVR